MRRNLRVCNYLRANIGCRPRPFSGTLPYKRWKLAELTASGHGAVVLHRRGISSGNVFFQSRSYARTSDNGTGGEETTIYALSTAPGRAAIAVIRISGPACVEIYHALCPSRPLPKPRYADLRTLYDPSTPPTQDTILDSNALVLYFPSPNTVTGEDLLELHVHGGPAIIKAVLAAIPRCSTTTGRIRYAEPGEFTRRAFLNDRLDLTQVEALGDTLSATTEQQRRLSVRGTTSGLARRYEAWRTLLLHARGELEALIDFSEDQHFDEAPGVLARSVVGHVRVLRAQIEAHRANAVRGELLRSGIDIALLGAPNAGKSSLMNRIVGREAAIVSQEAGTTRDVVEVGVDIGGWYCRLGDMAGLRKSMVHGADQAGSAALAEAMAGVVGEVEQEGIKRAKRRALESDLVIVVLSVEPADCGDGLQLRMDPEVIETATRCAENGATVIVVINKIDRLTADNPDSFTLLDLQEVAQKALPAVNPDRIFCISCKDASSTTSTAEDPGNIQSFLHGLIAAFDDMTAAIAPDLPDAPSDPSMWQESLGATERHRLLLEECLQHLDAFLAEVSASPDDGDRHIGSAEEAEIDVVVAAESLRAAAERLARITGRGEGGDVEEVLGVVFEKFCVGK